MWISVFVLIFGLFFISGFAGFLPVVAGGMQLGGVVTVCCVVFIFVAGFAGFLPVVAWGLRCKWLIISVFIGMLSVVAIAGLMFDSWF